MWYVILCDLPVPKSIVLYINLNVKTSQIRIQLSNENLVLRPAAIRWNMSTLNPVTGNSIIFSGHP
jgi:hypothetical protein